MSVDRKTVERIAELARLRLTDAEAERMVGDLGAILDYVAQLEELDLDGVEATPLVGAGAGHERDDTPRPSLPRDEVLAGAPDADDGHFVVPRVLPDP